MNIIEAREAAMAGKTVISPCGIKVYAVDFEDMRMIRPDWVFGEWEIKQEPVVFEARVEMATNPDSSSTITFRCKQYMPELVGKKVKVTVEVVE